MPTTSETADLRFSGDWEFHPILDCYETAYTAVAFGQSWNGFVTPVVTPNVMAAFVAREQVLLACGETVDFIQWDGNGVRVIPSDSEDGDESEAKWLLPDADGNFDLAPLGYTFEALDADDRVVRTVEVLS